MAKSHSHRDSKEAEPTGPRHMSSVITQLMARRGYNQLRLSEDRWELWQAIVGPGLGKDTRPGNISRGVWEIFAASSVVVQELTFRKAELLRQVKQQAPAEKIVDFKFRVGAIHESPSS